LKLGGQSIHTKNEDEEIEGVERPAKETGDERIPLHRGQPTKMGEKFHSFVDAIRRRPAKVPRMLTHGNNKKIDHRSAEVNPADYGRIV
jgi:hypothetical protein